MRTAERDQIGHDIEERKESHLIDITCDTCNGVGRITVLETNDEMCIKCSGTGEIIVRNITNGIP